MKQPHTRSNTICPPARSVVLAGDIPLRELFNVLRYTVTPILRVALDRFQDVTAYEQN